MEQPSSPESSTKLLIADSNIETLRNESLKPSKRQQKRETRKRKWLELRPEKRKLEREKKKLKRAEMKAAGIMGPAPKKKTSMDSEKASRVSVAIDLSFHHLMGEKDSRKTVKQLSRCYASNRHADRPLQLHVTSVNGDCKDAMKSGAPAYLQWDIHVHEGSYKDVFNSDNIVYLSSESDNVLDVLRDDAVYVIGGLVDHNAHKGLCYRLANENNVSHARLPIDEFVEMSSRKVLTINHVYEILLQRVNGKSWGDAFHSVIPKRKGVTSKDSLSSDLVVPPLAGSPTTTEELSKDSSCETNTSEKLTLHNSYSS